MNIPQTVLDLSSPYRVKQSLSYPDYFITEKGEVISVFILGSNKRRKDFNNPRKLKPILPPTGYPMVSVWNGEKPICVYVHILVLEAFIGPRPSPKSYALHQDGSRDNNHIDNLRWGSQKENVSDSKQHGTFSPPPRTQAKGEQNGQSKLKEVDIPEIRNLFASGITQREIAELFGVKPATISSIIRKGSWSWL